MIPRIRWVSFAVLALLTIASACPAAEGEPSYKPGKGGVGGQFGGSYFGIDRMFGDEWLGDYSSGAMPRVSFAGQFRYVQSKHWRWQFSPGFTWTAYKTATAIPFTDLNYPDDEVKDRMLVLMLPATAQIQYVVKRGQWFYHAGAGPGAYRVWVENRRKVYRDPETFRSAPRPVPGRDLRVGRRALPQVDHHDQRRADLGEPPGLRAARRTVPERLQQQPDGDGIAGGGQLLLRPAEAEEAGHRDPRGQVSLPGVAARDSRHGSRVRRTAPRPEVHRHE